jgi:hypothetical protein
MLVFWSEKARFRRKDGQGLYDEAVEFNHVEADDYRKIVKKQLHDLMEQKQKEFVAHGIDKGLEEEVASEIYKLIEKFADYGFNLCLGGDTVVETTTGKKYTMAELFENKKCMHDVKITATDGTVFVFDGWEKVNFGKKSKKASDLKVGDRFTVNAG